MDEIAKNSFIEWFEKDGNYYGISKCVTKKIYDAGKIPIIISGSDGLAQIHKHCKDCMEILVIPANVSDYRNRISTYLNKELKSKNIAVNASIIGGIQKEIDMFKQMGITYIEDQGKGQGIEALEGMVKERYEGLIE